MSARPFEMDPLGVLRRMTGVHLAAIAAHDEARAASEDSDRHLRDASNALMATVEMTLARGATWGDVADALGVADEDAARLFCLDLRHAG